MLVIAELERPSSLLRFMGIHLLPELPDTEEDANKIRIDRSGKALYIFLKFEKNKHIDLNTEGWLLCIWNLVIYLVIY